MIRGKRAVIKISFSILALVSIVFAAFYIQGVLADTHTSTATVSPNNVKASTFYIFTVHIENQGPASVSEFRIYMNGEFPDLVCNPVSGWNGPYYISGTPYDFCQYTAKTTGNYILPGGSKDFTFNATSPSTECCREISLETRDPDQYYYPLIAKICVDTSAPVTTKTFEGPQRISDGLEWIGEATSIKLNAVDPEPHPSGVDKTWYINLLVPEEQCRDTELCQPKCSNPYTCERCKNTLITIEWAQKECAKTYPEQSDEWRKCVESNVHRCCDGEEGHEGCSGVSWCDISCTDSQYDDLWMLYKTPFNKTKESCHLLQFFSVDNVGNVENMKTNCFFVDNTKPEITKTVGEPKIGCKEGECQEFDYWISNNTPINLHCEDKEPHPSDNVTIYWSYTVDSGDPIKDSYNGENYALYFKEDSVHKLNVWCKDAVGLESTHDTEIFKVDGTPPTITKTMLGTDHLGACPPTKESDVCYVKDSGGNGVRVDVKDTEGICAVNNVICTYELWWDKQPESPIQAEKFGEEGKDIYFNEDSTHKLVVSCKDALGNKADDEEKFLVDSTPPVTTKTLGPAGTYYIDRTGEWIDTATRITLEARDEKVGVDKIQYRVSGALADKFCVPENCENWMESLRPDMGEWNTYSEPFGIDEESCHVVEYRSIDKLGNAEDIKWQCMFVDKTAPVAYLKNVGEPNVTCKEGENCDYWVRDHVTKIELGCRIGPDEPHPAPLGNVEYRWKLDDGAFTDWIIYENPIIFNEDSIHTIEYKCKDAVGKESNTQTKIFKVDSTPPVISKEIIGPKSGDCPPEDEKDICFIDGVTQINVTATDPDPTQQGCAVNDVTCEWGYYLDDGKEIVSWNSTFPINFPEATKHRLVIKCKDALGNEIVDDKEIFYVDETPPITTKEYIGPYFEEQGKEWIDGITTVKLNVDDAGLHKSGIKETKYRVTLVNNDACLNRESCLGAQGSGDFLTYTAPFGINESCHLIEYYSVDNVNKTETVNKQCVFVDKTAPTPVKVIGEPKTACQGDECSQWEWKITKETPITLSCEDQGPHPSDHSQVCWRVWWDKTNSWSELTCQPENTQIYLDQNCLHQLQFYCVDAVGKTSQNDTEWIKVEGMPFNITLNKKWNLISTPVVLLNDKISEVFAGIAEDVESVWTYDPKGELCDSSATDGWCVYNPDDGAPSNLLKTMQPGWGYWIKALEPTTLVIGGDLLAPRRTPPNRDLVPGWNLIGYYGTNGLDEYSGPNEGGDEAYCSLYSLVNTNSFIPTKRWSSLFGYWDSDFSGYGMCNKLDPGAGYWIHLPADMSEYLYAPSTGCPTAFWDFICGTAS